MAATPDTLNGTLPLSAGWGALCRTLGMSAVVLAGFSLCAPAAWSRPESPLITAVTDTSWSALTPQQRQVLGPLAAQWPELDRSSREKWMDLASRYPDMPPAARERMRERMGQWARLPAQQRGEARLRFRNTRQLTPQERQQKWTAYQALPEAERQELAQQARRKQHPVVLPRSEPGPREPSQAQAVRENRRDGKANVVPNPLQAAPSARAVAPAVIKAGPGATTTLVTQPNSPALHQHTGLPKITATRGFVDPHTLLPRRGPQGAAMTPVQAREP